MNSKIILLVEDNPSDIALTQRAFKRNGVDQALRVAQDGQEALDYLFCTGAYRTRGIDDTPVVVLLDLKLPCISGLEVLRRIRADSRTRRIPVVILTSSIEEDDLVTAYDNGSNSYLRKPVDFHQFVEVVKQFVMYWLVLNEPSPQKGQPV